MSRDFTENIRNACEKHGYTLSEVEEAVGLPEGTVITWDSSDDDPVILESVAAIADYLNESVDFVITGQEFVSAEGLKHFNEFDEENKRTLSRIVNLCADYLWDKQNGK